MLTIRDDTSGVHDTLIAACDSYRYLELGAEEGHRNCADNLVEGLRAIGKPQFCSELMMPFKLSWWGEKIGWVILFED